jgi:hypothetical protein
MSQNTLKTGQPATRPDQSAHMAGIHEGNQPGGFDHEPGHINTGYTGPDRPWGKATARRSTSINAEHRNPIDPRSPNLPPA